MSQPPGTGPATYQPVSVHGETPQDIPYSDDAGAAGPEVHTPGFDTGSHPDLSLSNFADPDLPPGAARPRFMGAALAQEGIRQSYASSQQGSYTGGYDDAGSSVYALDPNSGARDSVASRGYASVPYQDDPHDADFGGEPGAVPMAPRGGLQSRYLEEKRAAYIPPKRSKRTIIVGSILAALLVIIAIIIALYFTVIKKDDGDASGNTSDSNSSSSSSGGGSNNPTNNRIKTGGDGSKVTMDDGTTFTYSNKFGGTWYYDEEDPFNNAAQANSWTPPLNQSFKYGIDRIYGVNIGGWLVTEPFIVPALYEKYLSNANAPVDEWMLSEAMSADTASGGLNQLEDHYKSFITEKDFAEIAGAGLNYVRIPIAFWAIETWEGEPFLAKTSWKYFLKAIKWARKYGIRINLDLHAVPGSQNGWNHSGRLGDVNFLLGPMGVANAQRTLDYIRIITEFVSQPQYRNVVTIFGVINEPRGSPIIGQENLANFYGEVYRVARSVTGLGEGKGPILSLHEGFCGLNNWSGFMTNADRLALDYHPYVCFGGQSDKPMNTYSNTPCSNWGATVNNSMSAFGLTAAGEFSNAVTDCGKWLNGVNLGTRYEGTYNDGGNWPRQGSCDDWIDYQKWSADEKEATKQFALASMDALQNWFFWTWKIGNSSVSGVVESPHWSYQLGLQEGWMPLDPRDSSGACGNTAPRKGGLQPWQTGGSGAGVGVSSDSLVWPPTSISNGGLLAALPTYTPTGTIATLPAPSFTASGKTIDAGNGWFNAGDQTGMNVPIATCSYLDPWVGNAAPPSPLCGAGGAAKRAEAPAPTITSPPRPRIARS